MREGVVVRNPLVALAFLWLPLAGCAASSPVEPTPSPTPAAASLSLSVSPDPVTATETDDPKTPLRADWVVTITSAGAGGTVNFVNATLRDGTSGAEAEPSGTLSLGPADITAEVGSTRVEPQRSLAVAQSLEYGLPSGGRVGVLTVTVQLTDDDGNLTSKSVQVAVN